MRVIIQGQLGELVFLLLELLILEIRQEDGPPPGRFPGLGLTLRNFRTIPFEPDPVRPATLWLGEIDLIGDPDGVVGVGLFRGPLLLTKIVSSDESNPRLETILSIVNLPDEMFILLVVSSILFGRKPAKAAAITTAKRKDSIQRRNPFLSEIR